MKPLSEWRSARHWSVHDLAAVTGLATKTLIDLEKGRRLPQYRSMRQISSALEVEPGEITEFAEAIEERASIPDRLAGGE